MTGRPPFDGGTPENTLLRIRSETPVRPRKHQREIPDELERIVLKMLAKHQEDRYQTPTELLAELQRVGAEHEVET